MCRHHVSTHWDVPLTGGLCQSGDGTIRCIAGLASTHTYISPRGQLRSPFTSPSELCQGPADTGGQKLRQLLQASEPSVHGRAARTHCWDRDLSVSRAGRASLGCCLLIFPPDFVAALTNSFLCVEESGKQTRLLWKPREKKLQWPCTIFHMPLYQSQTSYPHKLEK